MLSTRANLNCEVITFKLHQLRLVLQYRSWPPFYTFDANQAMECNLRRKQVVFMLATTTMLVKTKRLMCWINFNFIYLDPSSNTFRMRRPLITGWRDVCAVISVLAFKAITIFTAGFTGNG